MFYDRFVGLCKERGVSPSAVMVSIGLNKSNATFWKKGSIPKGSTLQKLADYFGVSVDYLLGKVYTLDGVIFSDGTGFGGGSGSGSGFGDGTGYGGPIPQLPDEDEADNFEKGLEKLSQTARASLEVQLSSITEDLSYNDLENLVKYALFIQSQATPAPQPPTEAPQTPPAPQEGTEPPRPRRAQKGRRRGSRG